MKIAIVHDYLDVYGGAEVLANAVFEVFPEADVYTATYNKQLLDSLGIFKGAKIFFPNWGKYIPKKLLVLFLPFYFEHLDLSKYDLVISSTAHFAKGVKTNEKQIHISYIHTPPRFLYGYETSTKNRNAWYMKILLWPIDFCLRRKDQEFAKRPDFLLCNSKEVQNRIKRIYKRDAEVIYPFAQVDSQNIKNETLSIDSKSYLVISRLESYKNIDFLIKVFGKNNIPLIIAGTGSEEETLLELVSKYRSIKMLGRISEETKDHLYKTCKAVVCAVKNEDFGIAAIEPMAYGKPVIALKSGGYLETVEEDKTGVFFDDLNEKSLLGAIRRLQKIGFDHELIKKHAKKFTKEKFQKNIKNFVEEKLKWKSAL